MKTNYLFGYEVYTKNPETGENGWDIKFVEVVATEPQQAKNFLKAWPLFDVIILKNYSYGTDEKVTGEIFEVSQINYNRQSCIYRHSLQD